MGLKSTIRDFLSLYIGIKLLLNVITPLTTLETTLFGSSLIFIVIWFSLQKIGILR